VDIEVFHVDRNSLTGSLPASISAWKKMAFFSVAANNFKGALPVISNYGTMTRCTLLWPGTHDDDDEKPNNFYAHGQPG
jgi:hypothetical protein